MNLTESMIKKIYESNLLAENALAGIPKGWVQFHNTIWKMAGSRSPVENKSVSFLFQKKAMYDFFKGEADGGSDGVAITGYIKNDMVLMISRDQNSSQMRFNITSIFDDKYDGNKLKTTITGQDIKGKNIHQTIKSSARNSEYVFWLGPVSWNQLENAIKKSLTSEIEINGKFQRYDFTPELTGLRLIYKDPSMQQTRRDRQDAQPKDRDDPMTHAGKQQKWNEIGKALSAKVESQKSKIHATINKAAQSQIQTAISEMEQGYQSKYKDFNRPTNQVYIKQIDFYELLLAHIKDISGSGYGHDTRSPKDIADTMKKIRELGKALGINL